MATQTYTVSDLYNPHYAPRQGTVVAATGPVQAIQRACKAWKLADQWRHDLGANYARGDNGYISMRVEVKGPEGQTEIYSLRLNLTVHFKAVKED